MNLLRFFYDIFSKQPNRFNIFLSLLSKLSKTIYKLN
jgi:hypothetical protein